MRLRWPRIDPNKIVGVNHLARIVDGYRSDLERILNNGGTYADNMHCAVLEMSMTHGVPVPIVNPLRTRPRGIHVLDARDSNGVPMSVLGSPKLDFLRPDGFMGISVEYDLRHTEPCLIRSATGTKVFNDNTDTLIDGWDDPLFTRGSVITANATNDTFTFAEAGTYTLTCKLAMPGGFAYSLFQLYATIGGVGALLNHLDFVAFTNQPIRTMTGVFRVTAGQTLLTRGQQTSGGNRTVAAGAGSRYLAIHRLYNDSVPTGIVRLVLVGA